MAVNNVKINGVSIVVNSEADIPYLDSGSPGVVAGLAGYGTDVVTLDSGIKGVGLSTSSDANIAARATRGTNGYGAITTANYDTAVKEALCATSGTGATYTDAEKVAARTRIGAGSIQDVLVDGTTVVDTADNKAKIDLQTIRDSITAETTRATGAESTLTTNLTNEITRAQGAESTLTTNLTNEITRATAAEATLQTNINNEATRAQNVEATLLVNINSEGVARITADDLLSDAIIAGDEAVVAWVNSEGFIKEHQNVPVRNVKLAGSSTSLVVNSEAVIPYAQQNKGGVIKGMVGTGIFIQGYADESAAPMLDNSSATAGINSRAAINTADFGAITTKNFDYAVKAAMTDNIGANWTATQKLNARTRLGIDLDLYATNAALTSEAQRALLAENNLKIEIDSEGLRITAIENVLPTFATIDYVDSEDDALRELISIEQARAILKEAQLEGLITSEELRAKDIEDILNAKIDANGILIQNETQRALTAESVLMALITSEGILLDEEIDRAKAAEATLQLNINQEIDNRISGDDILQEAIDTETTRATNVEVTLNTKITEETTRAEAKELELSNSIISENTRALTAEELLQSEIDSEANRAQLVESGLQIQITSEGVRAVNREHDLEQMIISENSRARSVEDLLNANLAAEIERAKEREDALQVAIDSEGIRAILAEFGLQEDIDLEVIRAQEVEADLQEQIDSEGIRAQAKEATLQAEIEDLDSRKQDNLTLGNNMAWDSEGALENKIKFVYDAVSRTLNIYNW